MAGAATLLVTLVALPAAYHTARHRFPGRGAFLLPALIERRVVSGLTAGSIR